MTENGQAPVTMLGLGAMGRALATAVADAGRPITVWNRSPGRTGDLVARGAVEARTVGEAVAGDSVVVVCLFDHASVHEVLDPVASSLSGRTLINLTTTTPTQARELADWARNHGIVYLDGGVMATPDMIGARARPSCTAARRWRSRNTAKCSTAGASVRTSVVMPEWPRSTTWRFFPECT